jgi:hypothetical protein
MSHTLHRRGTPESFKKDYVIFAMSAKKINDVGSNVGLSSFLKIISKYGPVNLGDMKTGNRFITPDEAIIDNVKDTSIVHGVFDNREALIRALQEVKEADLGVSVIISGLLDGVRECCGQAGLGRHTCETSLGIWGRTGLLPDEDILNFSTMCGHGQVPFNLVKKMIADIKEGRRTVEEAAAELARPCQCGVFNPTRAAAMLEEILCLWGVRVS